MQAYEISKYDGAPAVYAGDLKAVRAELRTVPRDCRHQVRVTLVEFPHDKPAFLQLLNGRALPSTARRKWRQGVRGRLIEIRLDDD